MTAPRLPRYRGKLTSIGTSGGLVAGDLHQKGSRAMADLSELDDLSLMMAAEAAHEDGDAELIAAVRDEVDRRIKAIKARMR